MMVYQPLQRNEGPIMMSFEEYNLESIKLYLQDCWSNLKEDNIKLLMNIIPTYEEEHNSKSANNNDVESDEKRNENETTGNHDEKSSKLYTFPLLQTKKRVQFQQMILLLAWKQVFHAKYVL